MRPSRDCLLVKLIHSRRVHVAISGEPQALKVLTVPRERFLPIPAGEHVGNDNIWNPQSLAAPLWSLCLEQGRRSFHGHVVKIVVERPASHFVRAIYHHVESGNKGLRSNLQLQEPWKLMTLSLLFQRSAFLLRFRPMNVVKVVADQRFESLHAEKYNVHRWTTRFVTKGGLSNLKETLSPCRNEFESAEIKRALLPKLAFSYGPVHPDD